MGPKHIQFFPSSVSSAWTIIINLRQCKKVSNYQINGNVNGQGIRIHDFGRFRLSIDRCNAVCVHLAHTLTRASSLFNLGKLSSSGLGINFLRHVVHCNVVESEPVVFIEFEFGVFEFVVFEFVENGKWPILED